MSSEEVIYQSGDIVITRTMARFNNTTYPIIGIGSVRTELQNGAALFLIFAVVLFVSAVSNVPKIQQGNYLAIALAVLGAWCIYKAFTRKQKLMVRTASGDQQAYASRDSEEVRKIKEAIERAVQLRG